MRGEPSTFSGFTGGVNLIDPQYELSNKEARDARNIIASVRGAIRKRNGNATFATGASDFESVFAGVSPSLMIAQQGSTLQSVSTGGALTSLATGLSASARWEWVAASPSGGQGPYYGVNGVDTPRYVSTTSTGGTWTASAGSIPNGKYLAYMSNRVLVTGDASFPSRVYGSKILDPRTFASPDGWAVDLDASDGLPITGISSVGPYALVFKESKTWVIYDLDTGANRRLTDSVGCVSHRSIVETPKGTFWLARDGIYRSTGQGVERVSQRIQPLLESLVASNITQACGAFFADHYYLSISTSGTSNNLLLDYDLTLDCWWIHTVPSSQFAVWRLSTGAQLMGARPGLTRIDNFFVRGLTQDSGANFTAYWSSPFYSFGAPYIRKRLRRIHMDGKGFVRASLSLDFATGPTPLGDLSFTQGGATDLFGGAGNFAGSGTNFGGGALGTMPRTIDERYLFTPLKGVGRVFSLTLGNETSDALEVDSFTFNLTPRRN